MMEYVAIDVETTGLNVKYEHIMEFGGVWIRDGKVVDTLSMLIEPPVAISEKAGEITGITAQTFEELRKCGREAPKMEAVIGEITDFCSGKILVGHHLITDYAFLKRAALRQGISFEKEGYDTLKLMRRYVPECEHKTLSESCRWFGYEQTQFHRALADAQASAWLFEQLLFNFDEINGLKPEKLEINIKKEKTIKRKQKEYLIHLMKCNKISPTIDLDRLSENEASRLTDQIISTYGRVLK